MTTLTLTACSQYYKLTKPKVVYLIVFTAMVGMLLAAEGAVPLDTFVFGLLGIGLQRGLDDDWQELIETINRSPAARVAIDIPSGLNGLTGNPQPAAVRA